jgi:mRNA interferase MazF
VISVDPLGTGPSDLCIVVPLTTSERPNPLYVRIEPPEGGVRERSWAMPEMVRSISRRRLVERWGAVRPATLEAVLGRVRLLTRP